MLNIDGNFLENNKASKPNDTVELTCCLTGKPKNNNGRTQQEVTFQVVSQFPYLNT